MGEMRFPRITISLRGALFLVTMIAVYFAGVASRRAELVRTLDDLNRARKELALGIGHDEYALATHTTVLDVGDLDRIEKLLDRLDAYDARSSNSLAAEVERSAAAGSSSE